MNKMMQFEYNGKELSAIEVKGEPWFVAKQVCDFLELDNVGQAVQSLDEEDLTSRMMMSGGQRRRMKVVNEPGLYALIFKSRKAEAKAFKRWVAHEVLPSIRQKGYYSVPSTTMKAFEAAEVHYLTAKTFLRENGLMNHFAPGGLGKAASAYCKAMGFSPGKVVAHGVALYPLHVLKTVSARHLEASYPMREGSLLEESKKARKENAI